MRFIETVKPGEATGLVADVYGEVKRDFGVVRDPTGNSPFVAHSPHPELLAGLWSVLYETVLVDGQVRRADKEAIAATVSRINECPFCVDAHSLLYGEADHPRDRDALARGATMQAADRRRRELVDWAAATREVGGERVRRPPFGAEAAPEAIGTAVGFHYVNRVVSVFQGNAGMNLGPPLMRPLLAPIVGHLVGRALRRRRAPGRSLGLLPEAELPADLGWAGFSAPIAGAFARFAAAVERAGSAVLSEPERMCVSSAVAAWDGAEPPLGSAWLDDALSELDPGFRPTTRVALLSALAPHRVDDVAVERFRRGRPADRDLVAAVAWSALCCARRIGAWLDPARDPSEPVVQSSRTGT